MNTKIYKKIGIGIMLITMIVSLLIVFSASLQAEGDNPQDQTDIKCVTNMRPLIKQKNQEFMDYLKSNMQNKQKNSSLLDLILKRFEKYKRDLQKELEKYYPQAGFTLYTETTDITQCIKEVKDEISLMESLVKKYFTETSDIKTTSALRTKLQKINERLNILTSRISDMRGKYESLKDRVPCFLDKCISG